MPNLCGSHQKGQFAEDRTEVIRSAGNLRTVVRLKSDSNLIAGSIGHVLTKSMLELTPSEQRGLCRGGRIGLNVVGIDFDMLVGIDIFNVPACVIV